MLKNSYTKPEYLHIHFFKIISCLFLIITFNSHFFLLANDNINEIKQGVTIKSRLNKNEADQIIIFLLGKGIKSSKTQTKSELLISLSKNIWGIQVTPTDVVEAIRLLNQADFPKKKNINFIDEFTVRKHERFEMAEDQKVLSRKLTRLIENINGVESAEVLITNHIIYRNDFKQTRESNIHAVVFVKHFNDINKSNNNTELNIKSLIFQLVVGLEEDHFTLVTERVLP